MDSRVARIIDANYNRAREAVRVMEDYARFVLDDVAGSAAMKNFRHDLRSALADLPADILLAARDTPGDVGTTITNESEQVRPDARSVFIAAAKRLPEALRTIEEYAKTVNTETASRIEALRYRAYDLEQRLILRGQLSSQFAKVKLYVLVTANLCRGDWLGVAQQAIRGGAGCLQLREKSLEDGELLNRARQLTELCHRLGALSIINDRPDIALLADADGVHLGQTDMSVRDARRIVGPEKLIGISTHTVQQLRTALADCPDYVAVGPMFNSQTKPDLELAGVEFLKQAVGRTELPLVAIGGVTTDNSSILYAGGATCVCACSAVIAADQPRLAAEYIINNMDQG